MPLNLDTHIIDCEMCLDTANMIVAHKAAHLPKLDINNATQADVDHYRLSLRRIPPLPLYAPVFDHFISRCCDGTARFSDVRLLSTGTA